MPHHIQRFNPLPPTNLVVAVVGAGDGQHYAGIVTDEDDLAADGDDGGVHYAAEFGGEQASTVYYYVCGSGGMERAGLRDVG
ncbi:hypothetical protein M7I_5757 [Glarea lozoyensis 74030]|uniref:Uncharacterized protein n=1 Tax=Glarea lozoyensis (strain ATCC 74030 / MF5533) TaxID=1104152 RepID=H0ESR4_GLAL7|nr:hypothetical protein M7I_5757 [Glarea lozoyensis 74030]